MALWTPDKITTALWLDADDSSTIALDGSSNVEQWNDKSGNARNASQSTSSARPSVATAALNSLDALDFNGSSEFLTVGSLAESQPTHYFAVAKTRSPTTGGRQYLFDGAGGLNTTRNLCAMRGNSVNRYGGWANGWFDHSVSTDANFHVIGLLFDGSGSSIGVDGAVESVSTGTNNLSLGLNIGTNYEAEIDWLDGQIAELIVCSGALSSEDREKMEGYLAHKWGLAASLPAEHPYKSAPPISGVFHGTVIDKDGNPAERRISVLDATGQCVATETSDPLTGAYEIETPKETPHTLVFEGEPDRNAQVFANVIPGEPPA